MFTKSQYSIRFIFILGTTVQCVWVLCSCYKSSQKKKKNQIKIGKDDMEALKTIKN